MIMRQRHVWHDVTIAVETLTWEGVHQHPCRPGALSGSQQGQQQQQQHAAASHRRPTP